MVRTLAHLSKLNVYVSTFTLTKSNEISKVLEFSNKKGQCMWYFQICLHFVTVVNSKRRFGLLPYKVGKLVLVQNRKLIRS